MDLCFEMWPKNLLWKKRNYQTLNLIKNSIVLILQSKAAGDEKESIFEKENSLLHNFDFLPGRTKVQ